MATAAPTAHTEQPGTGHGVFPPFNAETYPSQLVWFALTFVILYVLMAKVALPRVGGILAARQSTIEGDLAEAERLKEQSDAALAAYEASLADARGRAQALAAETHAKQAADAEAARKSLETQLNARIDAAESSIAGTRASAMANVQSIATDAAAAIVERLTGTAPAGAEVAAAVAEAVKR